MIKFNDYKYEELNIEEIEQQFKQLTVEFKAAKTAKKQIEIIARLNELNIRIDTALSLVNIRFLQDVSNEYYSKQQDFCDESRPRLQLAANEFAKALIESPFKKAINKVYGPRMWINAEVTIKTVSPEVIADMIEDNKLRSKYSKLCAGAKIRFKGKIYNFPGINKFTADPDRTIRAAASKAYFKWYSDHLEEYDDIYDQMVKVRDRIAKKLGYENYVALAYLKMGRTDYNPEDVKGYRDQVYKYLVPLTKQLFRRQAKRLGIKGMKWYDYNLQFLSGNATPKGTPKELVEVASKMYSEMSPETKEYFQFMRDSDLLDLESRPNKSAGGFSITIPAYKAPFIYANFNGTSADVDVLTHEAGHAFMAYCCKDAIVEDNVWPTMEACEIHSMSMEFFAYPWLEGFFKEETNKYKFAHLSGCLTFIPYGVAVDEFQAFVYENPTVTPAARRAKWREIEKKYLPHLKYGNNEFLNNGGRWMRQAHIYEDPFYYIDYTIAQVCAFQFFNAMNVDYKEAWNRYLNLCKLGGSNTFLNLLKDKGVKLVSPFKAGCIKKVVKPLKEYLNQFDDSKM